VNNSNKLITILGPTAVGKTRVASQLAYNFDGEIISADSRQVYIGMDLGTGKDYKDYIINEKEIKSHLLDVVKPHCEFNLYLFSQLFKNYYKEIIENNKIPFLVGGTGMYLSSILQRYKLAPVDFNSERANKLRKFEIPELIEILLDLNPKLHNTTDLTKKERIIKAILIAESDEKELCEEELDILVLGIYEERENHIKKIRTRLKQRLDEGMIKEVEKLISSGITHEKLRFFGLEYKFISMYLCGELNFNDMYQKLASAIIQFSKRQMTWFRKMEKEGVKINWVKNTEIDLAGELINNFLQ
jgi:tRNA dimethylallyltransferase